MALSKKEQNVFQMILFRKNMGTFMPQEKLKEFWNYDFKHLDNVKKEKTLQHREEKIKLVEENLKNIIFLNWVQFVGITGSVAANICKKDDDIDVFIIVRNDRMWLYRGILTLKLGIKSLRRVWGKPFKDKIDTNFICEERGIQFSPESIFVLHELLFMIPVYNKGYYDKILDVNYELLQNYGIKRKQDFVNSKRNYVFAFLNRMAFFAQYVYMLIKKHRPDKTRLEKNNKRGRIAFFPEDFSKKKMREFKKLCENY